MEVCKVDESPRRGSLSCSGARLASSSRSVPVGGTRRVSHPAPSHSSSTRERARPSPTPSGTSPRLMNDSLAELVQLTAPKCSTKSSATGRTTYSMAVVAGSHFEEIQVVGLREGADLGVPADDEHGAAHPIDTFQLRQFSFILHLVPIASDAPRIDGRSRFVGTRGLCAAETRRAGLFECPRVQGAGPARPRRPSIAWCSTSFAT